MSRSTDFESPEIRDAVRLVSAALAASDYRRAYEIAEAALGRGAIHPALFSARALWLEQQKRDEDALADFERAASLAPKNTAILNAIGLCLTRLHRLDEAVSAFEEAIASNTTYTPSYHRKGIALGMAGNFAAARRAHEQAIKLNPRDTEALANLASIAARNGETKKALDYAQRALKLDPRQATAIAAQTLVANSQGRFAEAEQLARPLLDRSGLAASARAVLLGLLADALDGQERVADAFQAYGEANECLRRLHAPRFSGLRSATDFTRDLVAHFQAAPPGPPVTSSAAAPCRHVFLLGFFRSGTTLLGQVLASHPDIVTLEERDFLLDQAASYLSDASGLARLATLTDDEAAEERDAYWRRIADSGIALEGKVLVDKQPLNTIKLPLIAKLFPDAKIVFAVRDPRDVMLSCFRRQFEINAAMFDLLTLDGAAAFYDAVMQLAEVMQRAHEQPFFLHRYEDMIADFDGRITALCDYLSVPFSPAMREFYATASALDIRSPSASQVTRELYSQGVGQWRRYRDQLAPIFPVLAPWISEYGYPPE